MEALRKSLDQVSGGKKKTAKADAEAAKKVTNIKAAAKNGAARNARQLMRDAPRVMGKLMARKAVWGSYKPEEAESSEETPVVPCRSPSDR